MSHWRQRSGERKDAALEAAEASERRWRAAVHFLIPVVIGAALLGFVIAVRLSFFVFAGRWDAIGMGLLAVGVAMCAGAVAGLVYSAVGRPLRRVRTIGVYLAGIVTMAAYMLAAIWAIGIVDPKEHMDLREGSSQFAFGLVTLLFGALLGREFERDAAGRRRDRDAAT